MVGKDYLKLHNQGNIISNIRLLLEMEMAKDEYADSQGYFTKKAVARIAINSLIITSGSKVGEEALGIIDSEGDESLNSPLQNAKDRMLILRSLGLVSADYGSEIYSITPMGELMIRQFLQNEPNYPLLRELFLCISTSTENYDYNCSPSFNCCLGLGICYALGCLDYKLSSDEMPMLTTYDISDIEQFIAEAKDNRKIGMTFTKSHPHYPKRKNGQPLRQVSNLTRSINQILRATGIIEARQVRVDGRNYYVCTEYGKRFVSGIKNKFHNLKILTAYEFRKKNNITEQREICNDSYNALLRRGGIDIEKKDSNIVFSPYQMLPETSARWFLDQKLPRHPDSESEHLTVINSKMTLRDLKLSAVYQNAGAYTAAEDSMMMEIHHEIDKLAKGNESLDDIANELCEEYRDTDKAIFYPFVHALFNIIGLECRGEIARYDAYCTYKGHIIPVEIKSYTETPAYNAKGVRQAIENKIISYDSTKADDINYATIVLGYSHPENDSETRILIEKAFSVFRIKVIATDIQTIARMAVRRITENRIPDFDQLLTSYGVLND